MTDADAAPVPARRTRCVRYSPALARRICARVAAGESLRAVCSAPGMPDESSVRGWVVSDRDGFAALYGRAGQARAIKLFDDFMALIHAEPERDEKGRVDSGYAHLLRVRMDAMRWAMARLLPKMFGDKVEVTAQAVGVQFVVVSTGVPRLADPVAADRLLGEEQAPTP